MKDRARRSFIRWRKRLSWDRRVRLYYLRGWRYTEQQTAEFMHGEGFSDEQLMIQARLDARRWMRSQGHLDPPIPRGTLPAWLLGTATGLLVMAWFIYHRPGMTKTPLYPITVFLVAFWVTFGALRWVRRGQRKEQS